tara:strand:+ start:267 stop:506 length:240 start_codon:yes stop_codon:yes gene_type:complete
MKKNKIVYEPRKLTFKQKRMIVKAQKNLFKSNEEGKLTKHDGHLMWYHLCPVEKMEMFVGKGEECSWCGAIEKKGETNA